jgi:hypothetical protein
VNFGYGVEQAKLAMMQCGKSTPPDIWLFLMLSRKGYALKRFRKPPSPLLTHNNNKGSHIIDRPFLLILFEPVS